MLLSLNFELEKTINHPLHTDTFFFLVANTSLFKNDYLKVDTVFDDAVVVLTCRLWEAQIGRLLVPRTLR